MDKINVDNSEIIPIEQILKDKKEYQEYIKSFDDSFMIRKSFKEMFGYDIILFESGDYSTTT